MLVGCHERLKIAHRFFVESLRHKSLSNSTDPNFIKLGHFHWKLIELFIQSREPMSTNPGP